MTSINKDPKAKAFRKVCENGDLSGVAKLIDHVSDDVKNDTLMSIAAINGRLEIVKYLAEHGADVQRCRRVAFLNACINNNVNIIKYLHTKEVSSSMIDEAFLDSSIHSCLDAIAYLVEQGANIHTKNDNALHFAALINYTHVIKLLIYYSYNGHGMYTEDFIDSINSKSKIDIKEIWLSYGGAGASIKSCKPTG